MPPSCFETRKVVVTLRWFPQGVGNGGGQRSLAGTAVIVLIPCVAWATVLVFFPTPSFTPSPSSRALSDLLMMASITRPETQPLPAQAGRTSTRPLANGKEVVNSPEGTRPSIFPSRTPSLPLSAETNQRPVEPTNPTSFVSSPRPPPRGLWVLKPIDSGNMSLVVPPNAVSPQIRTPPKSTTLPSTSQNSVLPSTLLWVTRA